MTLVRPISVEIDNTDLVDLSVLVMDCLDEWEEWVRDGSAERRYFNEDFPRWLRDSFEEWLRSRDLTVHTAATAWRPRTPAA